MVVAIMGGYLAFGEPASAVHDTGLFELEGDAINNGSLAGDDWDKVCHEVTVTNDASDDAAGDNVINDIPNQCTGAGDTSGATAVSWASDGALNASIFTGGGSKDPSDVPNWAWKDDAGGLPDKSNLLHSFAARYSAAPSAACPGGGTPSCDVLYFGSDRYDNSGDAQQGFWFFQEEITLGTPGVDKLGGGTGFKGEHMNGDLLIVTDFSNGGDKSTISVYEWNTSCLKAGGGCADANLEILESSEHAKCTTVADGDAFCGIVNPANGTAAPWSFQDKTTTSEAHPANTYLNGEFYEGGVNLSVLGLSDRCFSSVLSETRTSTSTDAVLKDFVLGGFGSCETTIVTTPKAGNGAAIPQAGLSIGNGTVTAKDSAVLTVSGISTWSGSLQFYLCGPIAPPPVTVPVTPPATCESSGTAIGSAMPVTNATSQPIVSAPANITSVGRYCWRVEFTSPTEGVPDASDSASTECFTVIPVTPSLSTTAGPDVVLGSPVTDSAALSGTANRPGTPVINPPSTGAGAVAGGTITFKLYGAPAQGATGCGSLLYTSTPVTVSGNSTYGGVGSVASFTPTTAGTYHWVASYSGDSPNTNAVDHNTACNDSAEDVVVTPNQPTITTAQKWLPSDSATISATHGGPLAGSVRFRLYDNNTCTPGTNNVGLLYDSNPAGTTPIAVSGASPQTVSSNNTTVVITTTKTVSWLVEYTSTNASQLGVTSACNTENSALTITNG